MNTLTIDGTEHEINDEVANLILLISNERDGLKNNLMSKTESGAQLPCSGVLDGPKINDDMLEKAMVEAVKAGLLPQHVDFEIYNKNWFGMKRVLEAALAD